MVDLLKWLFWRDRLPDSHSVRTGEEILVKLTAAFPLTAVAFEGPDDDLTGSRQVRNDLAGMLWDDIQPAYIHTWYYSFPHLGHQDFLVILPAWLRAAILSPESDAAVALLTSAEVPPDFVDWLTVEQREVVTEVAQFIADRT